VLSSVPQLLHAMYTIALSQGMVVARLLCRDVLRAELFSVVQAVLCYILRTAQQVGHPYSGPRHFASIRVDGALRCMMTKHFLRSCIV
jgi:hypothetical protein